MINESELHRLAQIDPLKLTTEQQCGYVLKCLEAGLEPLHIRQTKFCGDSFSFDLIMKMIVVRGWAKKNKKSGEWIINR